MPLSSEASPPNIRTSTCKDNQGACNTLESHRCQIESHLWVGLHPEKAILLVESLPKLPQPKVLRRNPQIERERSRLARLLMHHRGIRAIFRLG